MEVRLTEIEILPVKPHEGLLAFCSFLLNDTFFVGNVAIFSRLDGQGYRLVYPTKTLPNGAKSGCFHPIHRDVAVSIEKQVTAAYADLLKKGARND